MGNRFYKYAVAIALASVLGRLAQAQSPLSMAAPLQLKAGEAFFSPLSGGARYTAAVTFSPTGLTVADGQGTLLIPAQSQALSAASYTDFELSLDVAEQAGTIAYLALPGGMRINLNVPTASTKPQPDSATFGAFGRPGAMAPPLQRGAKSAGLTNQITLQVGVGKSANGQPTVMLKRLKVNGAVVQNAAVSQTSGTAAGQVGFVCKAGALAVRNVRFLAKDPNRTLAHAPIDYKYYEGHYDRLSQIDSLKPKLVTSGKDTELDYHLAEKPNEFALVFEGTLQIPAAGNYLFELNSGGGADLYVNGKQLIYRSFKANIYGNPGQASVDLPAGPVPIRLGLLRHSRWEYTQGLSLTVTGQGLVQYPLQSKQSMPVIGPSQPFEIELTGQPVVQRCFFEDEAGKILPYGIAVGNPAGVHYGYDIAHAALVKVWQGNFLDVYGMWHSRGADQVAWPMGAGVQMVPRPAFAVLANDKAAWPDTLGPQGFTQRGYELRPDGMPVFLYDYNGLHVRDELLAQPGGTLKRHISFEGAAPAGGTLYCLGAQGQAITSYGSAFQVGGGYRIAFSGSGGKSPQPVLRMSGGGQEVLYPVTFSGNKAEVTYEVSF